MQNPWPELPYAAWQDTYATLHMWMQVVGKVALARAAPLNHSWGIAFHLTPRGLRTALLTFEGRAFTRQDTAATRRVAVVNREFAVRYWNGQSAVGNRFRFRTGGCSAFGDPASDSRDFVR